MLMHLPPALFIILVCIYQWARTGRPTRANFGLHILLAGYFVIYGLSALVAASIDSLPDYYVRRGVFDSEAIAFLSGLLAIASLFGSLAGYRVASRSRFAERFSDGALNLGDQSIRLACLVCLPLGLIFLLVYSAQYGGVFRALTATAAIRAGYGELTESASGLTFVKYFLPLSAFPLAYFVAFPRKWSVFRVCIVLAAAGLLFASLVLMGGRSRFVIFLVYVAAVYYAVNVRSGISVARILTFALVLVLSVGVVAFGKSVFSALSGFDSAGENFRYSNLATENEELLEQFGYFVHRVHSTQASLGVTLERRPYLFKDALISPTYLIPERLTGLQKYPSISYFNTETITGVFDSMIPPGVVAYGYYNGWFLGVVLAGFVLGGLFGLIDLACRSRRPAYLVFAYSAALHVGFYGFASDPRVFVNALSFCLFFFVLAKSFDLMRGISVQ